jgi:hypothetical protein
MLCQCWLIYSLMQIRNDLNIFFFEWQIDWDLITIENRWDEEGPQHVHSEEGMYVKLGLLKEDEKERKAREEACTRRDTKEEDWIVVQFLLYQNMYALC